MAYARTLCRSFTTVVSKATGNKLEVCPAYLQNTFNLIWSCGVQILLFVAGLQTIPEQLYEVGRVEGTTAWERFWYITVRRTCFAAFCCKQVRLLAEGYSSVRNE